MQDLGGNNPSSRSCPETPIRLCARPVSPPLPPAGAANAVMAPPRSPSASLMASAERQYARGDVFEAASSLRNAITASPTNGLAYFELGNCLYAPLQAAADSGGSSLKGRSEQQQAAEAEHAFRHALGSSATASPAPLGMAYNNLANLLSLRGRASEAERLLRLGLQLQPLAYHYNGLANLLLELPRGGSRRGVQYNSMARVEEAEELMRTAIVQEREHGCGAPPMEHAYRYNLANLLMRSARAAEALLEYDAALLLSPNNPLYREAARTPDQSPESLVRPPHTSRERAWSLELTEERGHRVVAP